MPLYFLHVIDGQTVARDSEGAELSDVAAALEVAIGSAREIMADSLRVGRALGLHRRIDIEDQGGDLVASVDFIDALPLEQIEAPTTPKLGSKSPGL